MAAVTLPLHAGPHGGEGYAFESDAPGTTADLPSTRPGHVERYEVRQAVDGNGESVDGEIMAIFIGTVRV